jgi:hypothetical protein
MPHAGFNLTFNVKHWFFDRQRVRTMLRITTRGALGKAGALVRTIARRSMRYVTSLAEQQRLIDAGRRKRLTGEPAPSAPGTPPRAIRPHPWIRRHLYYAYDPGRGSVVIGPVRLFTQVNVPALHEYGGRLVLRNRRRRVRKVGAGGEIRIGGPHGRTTKPTQDWRGGTVHVTYVRLRTAAQAARATRLNAQLYGPEHYTATFPRRPFMGPALAAVQPGLARLWLTSVHVA